AKYTKAQLENLLERFCKLIDDNQISFECEDGEELSEDIHSILGKSRIINNAKIITVIVEPGFECIDENDIDNYEIELYVNGEKVDAYVDNVENL
ncbi:hypothetical protein LCGC14_2789060, partial [marine sediment metagenome]